MTQPIQALNILGGPADASLESRLPAALAAHPAAKVHTYGKAPRPGRNPRTGESIPIEARKVVTFHASHKLKDAVQGDAPGDGDSE